MKATFATFSLFLAFLISIPTNKVQATTNTNEISQTRRYPIRVKPIKPITSDLNNYYMLIKLKKINSEDLTVKIKELNSQKETIKYTTGKSNKIQVISLKKIKLIQIANNSRSFNFCRAIGSDIKNFPGPEPIYKCKGKDVIRVRNSRSKPGFTYITPLNKLKIRKGKVTLKVNQPKKCKNRKCKFLIDEIEFKKQKKVRITVSAYYLK